jgi:Flp pilus assembly protein TadD
MQKLTMMLVAIGLLVCCATSATAATPDKNKLESARIAEEKGDLARLHEDYLMASAYFQAALRGNPQKPSLLNKMGIVELQLRQRGEARKYFSKALKVDPQNFGAMNNLGVANYLDKKYKPAVNYFKQALALDETNASTHLNLAEAWIGLGEMDRAMTEYSRALELNADILTTSRQGIQAQVSTPEQRARVDYFIAKAYAKRGNLEGALDFLGRAKEGRYTDLKDVYKDPVFTALWQDPRLAKIVKP